MTGTQIDEWVSIAYGHSRATIIDEQEHFAKYNILRRGEFCEFISRAAQLMYADEDIPLVAKTIRLLSKLLAKVVNVTIQLHEEEDNAESESDQEDQTVEDIIRKTMDDQDN